MAFPSSIPVWNKLKIPIPGTLDPNDKITYTIELPRDLSPYFWGMITMLNEPNLWENTGIITPEEIAEVATNEVQIVDICSLVAQCIGSNEEVENALVQFIQNDQTVQQIIRQGGHDTIINGGGGNTYTSENDDLDYVWNGCVQATSIVLQSAINQFSNAMAGVTSVAQFLQGIEGIKWLNDLALNRVEAALDIGVNAVLNWLNDPLTQEDFSCGVFDSICSRGKPYIITPDDINAGFDTLDVAPGFPITQTSDVLKAFFSYDKYTGYWEINTDTPDNNWEQLCTCNPIWTHVFDFTVTDGGFVGKAPLSGGTWVNGVGWQLTEREDAEQYQLDIVRNFPIRTMIELSIEYALGTLGTVESWEPLRQVGFKASDGSKPLSEAQFVNIPQSGTWEFTGSWSDIDQTFVQLRNSFNGGVLTKMTLKGEGESPF